MREEDRAAAAAERYWDRREREAEREAGAKEQQAEQVIDELWSGARELASVIETRITPERAEQLRQLAQNQLREGKGPGLWDILQDMIVDDAEAEAGVKGER